MPRISANLGFLWSDRPLEARIEAAAAVGFRAVELHYPYQDDPAEIARLCAGLNVELLGINTDIDPGRGEFGLAAVPGRQGGARRLIDKAFDWAERAGARAVHVMAGNVPEDERQAAEDAFLTSLEYAATRARASGMRVLIEPLNRFDAPGYFLKNTDQALAIIEKCADQSVRLMFDAYHVARTEGDPVGRLGACWNALGHVQIAGVPGRDEPDRSALDLAPFLRALDRRGWSGWVGAEYRPSGRVEDGLGWIGKLGCRLE